MHRYFIIHRRNRMPGFHFSNLSVKFRVAAMSVLSAHKALYSYTHVQNLTRPCITVPAILFCIVVMPLA
jgi:hypothetical protein